MSENVVASTFHNTKGLHVLLQGELYLIFESITTFLFHIIWLLGLLSNGVFFPDEKGPKCEAATYLHPESSLRDRGILPPSFICSHGYIFVTYTLLQV
jgi:hypothetical protein